MPSKSKAPYWVYLAIAFVVLQLLDGILTSIGVCIYGLDLEANPLAASTFAKFGVYQSALLWKAFSFVIFFGLLGYCVYIRWSMLDVVGLLWKRKPKRDKAYAMACFSVVGVVTTLASLYAGGGWIYVLIYLGLAT